MRIYECAVKGSSYQKNNLIACIGRKRQVIVPDGDAHLEVGDSVMVVTKDHIVSNFSDILG